MRPPRETKPADPQHERGKRPLPSVPYDVAAGLNRHRKLVAAGTPLPEWIDQLPAAPQGRRIGKWRWWLAGALSVVAATFLSLPSAQPARQRPASESAAAEQSKDALAAGRPAIRQHAAAPVAVLVEPKRSASEPAARPGQGAAVQVGGAPQHTATGAVDAQQDRPQLKAQTHRLERAPGAASRGKRSLAPLNLPSAAPPSQARYDTETQGELTGNGAFRSRPAPTVVSPQDREEMEQLAHAEQLLSAQPAETLRLVRAGETQFPRGYFRQERRYLEVMALLALGQHREAEAYARWFLRDYPVGPYRKQIAQALQRDLPK